MIGQLQKNFRRTARRSAIVLALWTSNNFIFKRFLAGLCLACITAVSSWAQDSLEEFNIAYVQPYQITNNYSIMYDNPSQTVKINEFKIEFYDPDYSKLGETLTESFPINGTNQIYSLADPIVGFESVKISIISLHAGDITNFPLSEKSILALTEENIPPKPKDNSPPIAKSFNLEIEASTDTDNRNISANYSDPDGDAVTVTPKTVNEESFSYSLNQNGDLIFFAPSETGTFSVPYEVKDSEGAKASATATINIILPEKLKSDIDTHISSFNKLLTELSERETQITILGSVPDDVKERLKSLLSDNQALSNTITETKLSDVKDNVDTLTKELENRQSVFPNLILEDIENLTTKSKALKTQLKALRIASSEAGIDITALSTELTRLQGEISAFEDQENTLQTPLNLTSEQMNAWENRHIVLKNSILDYPPPPPGVPWLNIILAVIGAALLLLALNLFRKRVPKPPHKSEKEKEKEKNKQFPLSFPVYVLAQTADGFTAEIKSYPHEMRNYNHDKNRFDLKKPSGFVFPQNPSFETLTPDLKAALPDAWRIGYNATGRIGLAQEGVPIGEDDCLGSCILIAENYIITNRHVLDYHYKRIMDPEELIGVEFYGELDSEQTEYYKISNQEIYILDERDAVILKLETAVDTAQRPFIKFSNKAPASYVDDEIMLVGYPVEPNLDDLSDAQQRVFENIEIYSVKRVSSGRIFSHQNDTDGDFIVETKTSEEYSKDDYQPAISYDASSLPGNSGGPVLSKNTGDVIGLHFGDGRFETQPANVGHSAQILGSFVTYVTSGTALNMASKTS